MATCGLDAAVGHSLKELVRYDIDLFGGFTNVVYELCEHHAFLRSFLQWCIQTYPGRDNSEIPPDLVNDVRKAIHRAEDANERYIFNASRQKLKDAVAKMPEYESEILRVRKEAERVRQRVQEFLENLVPLGSEDMEFEDSEFLQQRREQLPNDEEVVIGLQDEAERVKKLLTRYSEGVEVISIIGMGGIGKTTLARKVFNCPEIKLRFGFRAFVTISQEYRRREVFLKILQATEAYTVTMNEESDEDLANRIRRRFMGLKYLVVLDDVWTTEIWDDLKIILPSGYSGRVLITSRYSDVAIFANPMARPHFMRLLNDCESWELLLWKVFGENPCPEELVAFGKMIARNCKGLPLAIVTTASILLNNRSNIEWWRMVAEGMGTTLDIGEFGNVLKLNFDQLPYHLKPCLLYLGLFPEDSEIPVWKLIRLWIAEGFLQQTWTSNMEDVAEKYLEELVGRNLVMVSRRSKLNGQIKTCRMHDLMRDFCKRKIHSENLFKEIGRHYFNYLSSPNQYLDTCRGICLNSCVSEYFSSEKHNSSLVRSLLNFATEEINSFTHRSELSIFKDFQLLRVLDVTSIRFTCLPTQLCFLVLLRYLAIFCDFQVLPVELSNLRNLQTLIIQTSFPTLEIKADIWRMTRLRHVHINAAAHFSSAKDNKYEQASSSPLPNANLQTLSLISPKNCTTQMFQRTPKLRKLGVRGRLGHLEEANGESSGLFRCLPELEYLEILKLLNDDETAQLHALPDVNMFPKKLVKLTLSKTYLEWKYMSTLGKLPYLQSLKLKDNAFVGEIWEMEDDSGFLTLKVLQIVRTNLNQWKCSDDHFPQLTYLVLRHCTELEMIPLRFESLPTLQSIDLYDTNRSVVESAKCIEEEQLNMGNDAFRLSVTSPDQ